MRYIYRPGIVIISCVTALQAFWCVLLIGSDEPLRTAPLSALSHLSRAMALVLLLATVALALYAIFHLRIRRIIRLVLLMPQLGFILSTAFRSVELVRLQHYADGVIRPWPFIAADQAPIVALALFYCVGLTLVCTDYVEA